MVRCRHLVRDLNDRSSPPSRLWRIFHPPYYHHRSASSLTSGFPALPAGITFRKPFFSHPPTTLTAHFLFLLRRFSPLTSYQLSSLRQKMDVKTFQPNILQLENNTFSLRMLIKMIYQHINFSKIKFLFFMVR